MLEHLNGIELITIDELQSMLNIDTEIAQIIMQELINNEIIIPIDILYEVKSNGKLLETCKKHLI